MNDRMPRLSSTTRILRAALIAGVLAGVLLPVLPQPAAAASSFTPVADSYVESDRPTRNNGTKAQVRVDASPILNTYLRFNVQGATDFSSAKLRVFTNTTSSAGFAVRPVANTTWGETTITYGNAPAFGAVAATSGPLTSGTWVAVDVSSLITQNGLVSIALTGPGSTAISMASRESATDPELVVGPGVPPPTGTAFQVSRDGATATYRATSADAAYVGTLKSVVESAIAQLDGAGGGAITFTAGDFDLGTTHFELDGVSNIVFSGAGIGATVLRNFTNAATDTEPFDVVVATNLQFRDFTVRAGGAFRTTSDALDFDAGNDILIERVAVTESRGRGIVFDGKGAGWTADRNVVRDCVISGVPSDGIELLASSGNLIERCSITNVGGHGIQAVKSSTSASQPNKKSNDNIIRQNTVDNAGQDGINISSGDRNQIRSNVVTNSSDDTSGRDGIRIASNDSISCNDNVVDMNTATDNQSPKTQSYGLNIANSQCNRTVVGGGNNFAGNRLAPIRDLGTGTIYDAPPPDTQDPTAPTNLQGAASGPNAADLSWNAATDNVAVTGYDVYRNGILLIGLPGTSLTFHDTGLSPSSLYSYYVVARDAAGNTSPASGTVQVTTTAASDTEDPTAPTGLQGASAGPNAADLSWNAATDNVGVTGYNVYRDGSLRTSLGTTLTFHDTGLTAATQYAYTVTARDAAGNESLPTAPVNVTTDPLPSGATITPVADSWVDASQPAVNFGTSTQIRVDGSPVLTSYLKFDVQVGAPITRATLRIFANSAHSVGYSVQSVADTTWGETTITAANAPAFGGVALASGGFTAGTWVEVDVTALIAGNGLRSLALTTTSSTAMSLASRQAGANAPQLVLETN